MFLLYGDDAGSANKRHLVIGGLAVHEQDARPLARAVEEFSQGLDDRVAGRELHAQHIRTGKGAWRRITPAARSAVTEGIASLLLSIPDGGREAPILFATALDRRSRHRGEPLERVHEEFFKRCDGMLGRRANLDHDYHRCIGIVDKSRSERQIQSLMDIWRTSGSTSGARIGQMASYAEVPLYVDSEASRLVQLADFVAHWVFRAYEFGDQRILERLLPAFDRHDGVIHGLVHLVDRRWTCDCHACRSRRPRR